MSAEVPHGLRPGVRLLDLELPDQSGNVRRLSELVAGDPTLVVFSCGWWCPKEQRFMRGLVALQDEIEVAYARLVTVSVDPPEVSAAFRAGLGALWTFLCDHERRYLDVLGLHETADTLHHPYLPAAVLVLPGLEIRRAWNGYWFVGRPTLEEIRQGFREMSRMVRPDWVPPG